MRCHPWRRWEQNNESLEASVVLLSILEAYQLCLVGFQLQTIVNRHSQSLKWYQVVNAHGGTGRHIPVDLYIEHLNQMLKDSDADMGENLSDSAAVQCSKSLKDDTDIVHRFGTNTNILLNYHRILLLFRQCICCHN